MTEELDQKAPRPLKAGLIVRRAEKELDFKFLSIEEGLEKMRRDLSE